MATALEVFTIVGGAGGIAGLLGAAAGFGALRQRLIRVEADVESLKDLGQQVARIDERTKNTAETAVGVSGKVDTILSHLLDESRSFVRAVIRGEPQHPQGRS